MGERGRVRNVAVALVAGALLCTLAGCTSDASSTEGHAPSTPTSTAARTATPAPTPAPTATGLPAGIDAAVVSVTDGDTITVRLETGQTEKVRLTGIDTPETRDPRTVVECFGTEASAHTHALLPAGTPVRLETDVERRDRYSRLLAYVWRVDDGLFVNEALVAGGWAAPYRVPPNVKYADRFTRLGAEAREANAGLWGACGDTNTPATGTPPTGTEATGATRADTLSGGCDPNYSGACVPISATDLDCGDVGAHDFVVVGTDVHRFDGDHDGVACE